MTRTKINRQELEVPLGAFMEVADSIPHKIIGVHSDSQNLILEIDYAKDQWQAVHEMEDIISAYEEEKEDDDDD